jgi:hypothetical protein
MHTMTTAPVPDDATKAAATAICQQLYGINVTSTEVRISERLAEYALAAAYPLIAAQAAADEREAILDAARGFKWHLSYTNPIRVPDAPDLGGEIILWAHLERLIAQRACQVQV